MFEFFHSNYISGRIFKVTSVSLFIITLGCSTNESSDDSDISTQKEVITKDNLKAQIKEIDDSLENLLAEAIVNNSNIDRLVYHEGVNRNIKYFENYPNDDFTPYAVDKIASMYWALQIEEKASKWIDTLIIKYPEYPGLTSALERQKSLFDDLDHHDTLKIRYYTNLLLNRSDVTNEKRTDLLNRLKHIEKPLSEYINMINEFSPVEPEIIN